MKLFHVAPLFFNKRFSWNSNILMWLRNIESYTSFLDKSKFVQQLDTRNIWCVSNFLFHCIAKVLWSFYRFISTHNRNFVTSKIFPLYISAKLNERRLKFSSITPISWWIVLVIFFTDFVSTHVQFYSFQFRQWCWLDLILAKHRNTVSRWRKAMN